MDSPLDVVVDITGLYIPDNTANITYKITHGIDFSRSNITTLTGVTLQEPFYCTAGDDQNAYCSALGGCVIYRIERATGIISIIAGTSGVEQSTGEDGSPASMAFVWRVRGLVYDTTNDRLFFAEEPYNRIRYIQDGKIYHYIGSRVGLSGATSGFCDNDTCINGPSGLDYNSATGELYLADYQNNVRVINSSRYISSFAPSGMLVSI